MNTRVVALIAYTTVALATFASAQKAKSPKTITPADAGKSVGKRATVCGKVASTRYLLRSHGQPTFLNLDEAYPNQIFTIVIWGTDRQKFNTPEDFYRDKNVCVTGKIQTYQGTPEIVATEPRQIQVQGSKKPKAKHS